MRTRLALLSLGVVGAGAWFALATRDAPADPSHVRPAPAVVLLEGDPAATETRVVLRVPASGAQPRVLGTVSHVAGSARRATLSRAAPVRAFVIAAERASRRGSTYQSALWRVQEGVAPTRLRGSLTDASRPLVTARGTVIVQSGRDGDEPIPDGSRALRERVDALTLDAVDPDNGTARTLWSGRGMIAFLAAPLKDDEALVYHVHADGASLFALDASTGATRALIAQMEPLARDFSYDAVRDEVTFVRASARHDGSWEVVSVAAHGVAPPVRVRWRADSDHLMPRALSDGAIVVSLPDDRGLARLDANSTVPARLAPLGDGADEALDESADGRWLAFRHRTADRELFGLHARAEGRTVTLDRPGLYAEFVGFVEGAAP
jgi:hypothetical protein